jgi:hypothetical protein
LLDRIYGEYQAYKAKILSLSNAEIFSKCYEIDIMTNLYDILSAMTEKLDDDTIRKLLERRNILEELYERWLKRDDNVYAEIGACVSEEVDNLIAESASCGERSAA